MNKKAVTKYWSLRWWVRWFVPLPIILLYLKRNFHSHVIYQERVYASADAKESSLFCQIEMHR